MSEAEFFALMDAWDERIASEVLAPKVAAEFRALCREQARVHRSEDRRALFARAAALPVLTVKMARAVAPFVEKPERWRS